MTTPLLEIRSVSCERGECLLFEQLSFSLNPGEVVQIEGKNGCGKTTLLRIISGLSSAYWGEVFWQGTLINKVRPAFYSELHYLGHLPAVKAALTPRENLRWTAALELADHDAEIELALDKVGLYGYEDVPSFTLSAGQQRRVALARLYLTKAQLWILDEPFTAIDKQGVIELEALLLRQHDLLRSRDHQATHAICDEAFSSLWRPKQGTSEKASKIEWALQVTHNQLLPLCM